MVINKLYTPTINDIYYWNDLMVNSEPLMVMVVVETVQPRIPLSRWTHAAHPRPASARVNCTRGQLIKTHFLSNLGME